MPQGEGAKGVHKPISVRFGDAVLDAGHTAMPNLVLDNYAELGVSAVQMMFAIHVWQHWWTERNPHPSLEKIAQKMGVTRRQARNYAQRFKELGLVRIEERHAVGQGQLTNEYDFSPLISAVVKLAEQGTEVIESTVVGGRKNISEGGRKFSSSEEDQEQEDEVFVNGISRKVMERSKRESPGLQPIKQALESFAVRKRASGGEGEWLVGKIISVTGDPHSIGAYRKLARLCPANLLLEALASVAEAKREGISRRPGAMFIAAVRRLCAERRLADPLPRAPGRLIPAGAGS